MLETGIVKRCLNRLPAIQDKRLQLIQSWYSAMTMCRAYSMVIPKNVLKDQSSVFHKSKIPLPTPEQILHPFYSPTKNDEFTACFTEVNPDLLDGKHILPCLVMDLKTKKPTLAYRPLRFDTVRGVNRWLQEFRACKSQTVCVRINNNQTQNLIKPSKLDRTELPQLAQLVGLFGAQNSRQINSKTLDTIVDQLLATENTSIFPEDIYSYLLHHYVNSTEKITAIIESIISHLNFNIDQLKVAEILILQILMAVRKNNLVVNDSFVASFDNLLSSVNQRFHLTSCELQFQPAVKEAVLEHFISVGKINESKAMFHNLVSTGFLPREKIAFQYLQLLDETFGYHTSDSVLLKKFAYISDFGPIIENGETANLFNELIKYCRHMGEVKNLCNFIKKTRNAKDVFDGCMESLIDRICNLASTNMERSSNLCSLYLMVMPYYSNRLSERVSRLFLFKFAKQRNYSMVCTIIETQELELSIDLILSILSTAEKSTKPSTKKDSISVYESISKTKFISRFLLNNYATLDKQTRFQVLSYLDDPKLFSRAFKMEITIADRGNPNILEKFMMHACINKFLCFIAKEECDRILDIPHVRAALKGSGLEIESFRKKDVSKSN